MIAASCICGGSRAAHGFSVAHNSLEDCAHCDACPRFRSTRTRAVWRRVAQVMILAGCAAALLFVALAGPGS